jgi:hypothetical protein
MTAAIAHTLPTAFRFARTRAREAGPRRARARDLRARSAARGDRLLDLGALREQGCSLAQGYFIGRPTARDELVTLLAERAPAPAVKRRRLKTG